MHASDPQKNNHRANGLKNYSDEPRNKRKDLWNDDGTIWTVCPYCYCLYQHDGVYEDCCLRCQNCRKPFHGVAVSPPSPGVIVEGKEQYYCTIGCFPLKYNLGSFLGDKKGESVSDDPFLAEKKGETKGFKNNLENFVLISDDSDDDYESGEKREDKNGKFYDMGMKGENLENEEERVNVRVEETMPMVQGSVRSEVKVDGISKMKKRMKSVARNTKKVMGRGKNVKLKSIGNPAKEKAEFGEALRENGSDERYSKDDLVFSERW